MVSERITKTTIAKPQTSSVVRLSTIRELAAQARVLLSAAIHSPIEEQPYDDNLPPATLNGKVALRPTDAEIHKWNKRRHS